MDSKQLPARPSLEQYKKQAKNLLKSRKSGDPEALQRIRQHHTRLGRLSDSELQSAKFSLADAQFIIAREHGFESWPKFAKHIEARTRESSQAAIWESAQNALIGGDLSTLERLLGENPELFREHAPPPYGPEPGRLAPDYSGGDARSIIVNNHHFESWAKFVEYTEAMNRKNSRIARFESAVEAIITGEVARLERLLGENPELIRARSMRKHHATLLHYVGANGVENFRQKTPKNAARVAEILLKAGAEVDAVGEMYGGTTALGLVATSVHPLLAGVQEPLIEILLDYGASLDGAVANDYRDGRVVNACLANGRGEAAEFLARRGAPLDLEGSAALGRLDVVKSFFKKDGRLKANTTKAQMESGFLYACGHGRTSVVEFLLQKGIEVATQNNDGETGLHWAAYSGHMDVVKLLLERKAPVDVKDKSHGKTPLGWAIYGWSETPPDATRNTYVDIVELLVAAGSTVEPEWLADEQVRADSPLLAALSVVMARIVPERASRVK